VCIKWDQWHNISRCVNNLPPSLTSLSTGHEHYRWILAESILKIWVESTVWITTHTHTHTLALSVDRCLQSRRLCCFVTPSRLLCQTCLPRVIRILKMAKRHSAAGLRLRQQSQFLRVTSLMAKNFKGMIAGRQVCVYSREIRRST
jgi:hypothetical protein